MKNIFFAMFAAVIISALPAHAEQDSMEKPLWNCALTFHAEGGGFQFIIGSFRVSGPGKIHCEDIAGNHQEMNVKVTMGSNVIAPNIAIGHFNIAGMASGIGVATGPDALLGNYYTVGGEAAVIVGVGANMSLHGGRDALTLNLGVNVVKGAGLQLGFNKVKIEALN